MKSSFLKHQDNLEDIIVTFKQKIVFSQIRIKKHPLFFSFFLFPSSNIIKFTIIDFHFHIIFQLLNHKIQMEKQSSKPIQSLSFEELFQIAEEKCEQLDYDQAEFFYNLAYNKNPSNEAIVMCYANLLKQNDKIKQAKKVLEKSIQEYPLGTYKRYFELGEIYHGVQAIKSFQTGINEGLKALKNPFKNVTPETETKRDIAQAYASIAQICMTDLIDQKQAQGKCREALEKGVNIDPSCMDVHLQVANYELFKDNYESARTSLDIILNTVKSKKEENDNDLILQAAKYYIELEEYQKSSQLLEIVHEEQSNQKEVVYLLAYCAFKTQNYDQCEDFIQEYQDGKDQIHDEEIEEAMKELIIELKKINSKQKNQEIEEQDDWMDIEDQEN